MDQGDAEERDHSKGVEDRREGVEVGDSAHDRDEHPPAPIARPIIGIETIDLQRGAGGLGTVISTYLAAAGVGTLRIVDCDVVEESNFNRQILHWDGLALSADFLAVERNPVCPDCGTSATPLR